MFAARSTRCHYKMQMFIIDHVWFFHLNSYERKHECIPIKTFVDQKTGALKRYKSDEYLYADPQTIFDAPAQGCKRVSDDPIYQDPLDVLSPRTKSCVTTHGVSLDEEGYAVPDTPRRTLSRQVCRAWCISPPPAPLREGANISHTEFNAVSAVLHAFRLLVHCSCSRQVVCM